MAYRTYRLADGEYVSVDLSQHVPPAVFEESWEITQAAYLAIYAHRILAETPAGLEVDGSVFVPDA